MNLIDNLATSTKEKTIKSMDGETINGSSRSETTKDKIFKIINIVQIKFILENQLWFYLKIYHAFILGKTSRNNQKFLQIFL